MSSMIEAKTADLTGPALDWAVAVAIQATEVDVQDGGVACYYDGCFFPGTFEPSTDWEDGGPLIVSRMVAIDYPRPLQDGEAPKWVAQCWRPYGSGSGESPLIAACRAIVAAKLGETVQVPQELMP